MFFDQGGSTRFDSVCSPALGGNPTFIESYQSMVTDMTLHNHSTTHYLMDWHTSLKHISLTPQFTTPTPHLASPHHPRSFFVLASNPSLPSRNETDVFLRPPITYTTERIHHTQQLDLKTSQREAMLSAYHDLHPFSPLPSHTFPHRFPWQNLTSQRPCTDLFLCYLQCMM